MILSDGDRNVQCLLNEIALLSSILMPWGRMSLQILSNVIWTLSRDVCASSGFGVVWLKQGSEVSVAPSTPNIGDYGTYARIVDWDQLPNGYWHCDRRAERFDVQSVWREPDGLIKAEVQKLPTRAHFHA